MSSIQLTRNKRTMLIKMIDEKKKNNKISNKLGIK